MELLPFDVLGVIAAKAIHVGTCVVFARVSKTFNDTARSALENLQINVDNFCVSVVIGGRVVFIHQKRSSIYSDVITYQFSLDITPRRRGPLIRGDPAAGNISPFMVSVLVHKHVIELDNIIPILRLRPRWSECAEGPPQLPQLPQLPHEIWDIIAVYLLHNLDYAPFAAVSVESNKSVRRAIREIPVVFDKLNGHSISFNIGGYTAHVHTKHYCALFDIVVYGNDGALFLRRIFPCIPCNSSGICVRRLPLTKMVFNTILLAASPILPSALLSPPPECTW